MERELKAKIKQFYKTRYVKIKDHERIVNEQIQALVAKHSEEMS